MTSISAPGVLPPTSQDTTRDRQTDWRRQVRHDAIGVVVRADAAHRRPVMSRALDLAWTALLWLLIVSVALVGAWVTLIEIVDGSHRRRLRRSPAGGPGSTVRGLALVVVAGLLVAAVVMIVEPSGFGPWRAP